MRYDYEVRLSHVINGSQRVIFVMADNEIDARVIARRIETKRKNEEYNSGEYKVFSVSRCYLRKKST